MGLWRKTVYSINKNILFAFIDPFVPFHAACSRLDIPSKLTQRRRPAG